ncbi:MAG: S9 family peptidase [Candidatus Delongbacteria bacterium]|nr:S9 family peptidase [Candidatus Delongbacteria bacterium]MCG2761476.1 S9 family peptidase [Candidatus Delongbacteria bacterium]
MKLQNILLIAFAIMFLSCTDKQVLKEGEAMTGIVRKDYPVAEKERMVFNYHGEEIVDDYSWLKDKDRKNPKVLDYIKKENDYAKESMKPFSKLENKIYDEIVSKIDQSDVSVPVKIDDYFYYSKEIEGKQYPVHCRKFKTMDGNEEILLDLNEMAKGHDYFELSVYEISPDHKYLAYSIDTEGNEKYTLYIQYLAKKTLFPETFENVDGLEWAEENNTFFYTTVNESNRSNKVFRHVLGTRVDNDRLMYSETAESFYVWIEKTKSKKYILMESANKNTSEVYYLKSDNPMGFFNLIMARKTGTEYYPDHRGDSFYILTNADDAFNFKVVKVKESFPFKDKWEEYIPHRTDAFIDDIELFEDYIVISEISNGKRGVRVLDYESLQGKELQFSDNCYTVYTGSNPMFESKKFRYVYESMTTPYSIVEYDMESGERKFLKQEKVLGDFDQIQYKSELIYALAKDGQTIPISLVYKRDKFKQDGTNPLLLEGYGSYGDFNDPTFSISRLSLLDRGFVVGIAHIRGGLEKGKKWHYDGMLLNKKNTFNDFIDCAEYLLEKKYTSKENLIIDGASAGGLLIGAVLNMRPDLFKAAVLEVPFLDVINTMLDSTLSATVSEYDEWGDPHDKQYFDYMKSYCPYQNIKGQEYPNIFVTAGFNDPRVNYWEPAKWVAKLRDLKKDNNQILFYTNIAGHGGASGRYDYYKEISMKFAYMLNQVGITE